MIEGTDSKTEKYLQFTSDSERPNLTNRNIESVSHVYIHNVLILSIIKIRNKVIIKLSINFIDIYYGNTYYLRIFYTASHCLDCRI